MLIRNSEIWMAYLNTRIESKPVLTRPVLVVQSNMLNNAYHPTTIICPLTANIQKDAEILRVNIPLGMTNLKASHDIMIDQVRTIDNNRFIRKLGDLPEELAHQVKQNLSIILGIT